MTGTDRKLIEVALPLEAISRESSREKSVRVGHPSTLHLWWSRKPLAAARAVLMAQLIDDPSSRPQEFPTISDQSAERLRLLRLIERVMLWESTNNRSVLREAEVEIRKCFPGGLPVIVDPFAGGGSIPSEAQRLGLPVEASDLNPVAVLMNKAVLELPATWAGRGGVHPEVQTSAGEAPLRGLSGDVNAYGEDVLERARQALAHLYPSVPMSDGTTAVPFAWIYCRTAPCANPACGAAMPLLSSFWLSRKRDRPTWLKADVDGNEVRFSVAVGGAPPIERTIDRSGARCLACGTMAPLSYVRQRGQDGLLGNRPLVAVVQRDRRRVYVPAVEGSATSASTSFGLSALDEELVGKAAVSLPLYGMRTFDQIFLARQKEALSTILALVQDVGQHVAVDAGRSGMSAEEAAAYSHAVRTYLCMVVSRMSDYLATTTTWASNPQMEILRNTFALQALPMTWLFAEGNPLAESSGSFHVMLRAVTRALDNVPAGGRPLVTLADAATRPYRDAVVCTDPPYYNNIEYADLSDFFYVWLRQGLSDVYPDLFHTALTPKGEELIAAAHRFPGGQREADEHFEQGFERTFARIRDEHRRDVPLVLYYAFKQNEETAAGAVSTGWEKMLAALVRSGFGITATWPIRTERAGRSSAIGANSLASSVVIVCRVRSDSAASVSRRTFLAALREELPAALRELQQGAVAPVDLPQAAIGPGMAVFTRYSSVVEADGSVMSVRTALALINRALDEVLSEQEGDFSADTRFCVKWFGQFGWDEQPYGVAESLSKAVATSVDGLCRGGVFWARAGRARLVGLHELSEGWDPLSDERVTEWEVVLRVAKALDRDGVEPAARLLALAGQRVDLDTTKELAYLLYSVCEKRGWPASAGLFNGLGTSWSDLSAAGRTPVSSTAGQGELDLSDDEEA